ncbi:MAG: M24 family metallopeptidase [Verrucomicrobia bacterium]|nr:M24 family metallopeptidase [Verrucomicrobiota bacterium]MDA1067513.1 M24 family metallopeptidase [Verrucomicrobiota bacterium]
MPQKNKTAMIMAGPPEEHASLFRRIQFSVHDPVVLIELEEDAKRILILRDIEMERAKARARVNDVHCPADFTPVEGLSGDRQTATAQAAAECLRRNGVTVVRGDRMLPLVYVEMIRRAGIEIEYDPDLGVLDRRQKTDEEVAFLREAQGVTEEAVELVCRMIARADADADGVLINNGQRLSSEYLRLVVDRFLMEKGYHGRPAIIAGGPPAADCHNLGWGDIKTSTPVIVDIFPSNLSTRYCGDCTRTVVHGDVPDEVLLMHAAVAEAKRNAIAATKAGVTGQSVHQVTLGTLAAHGYSSGLPAEDDPDTYCAMTCGTGHGIGLEVHEPPLLDFKGPELLVGDALTIEPGLYCKAIGAIRLEDMVVVREEGCENLNTLPEGLDWK